MTSFQHLMTLLPPANEVWGKVIFSEASVILLTWGVCFSACWDTPPLPRRPPAKETPCQGDPSRSTNRGEIEGDQVQAHRQGGNWGGSDPGPHPRGNLRGIRSRPTPKGEFRGIRSRPTSKWEIQGDLDQTPLMTTAAGGIHPTGMHSCFV